MNQVAHCDLLLEWARLSYMYLACSTRHVLQEKFPQKPNNKSFIDQGFLVKMDEYWPSFLRVYGPRLRLSP